MPHHRGLMQLALHKRAVERESPPLSQLEITSCHPSSLGKAWAPQPYSHRGNYA